VNQTSEALATGRIRLCIWYVAGYLVLSGLLLLIAPRVALSAMLSNTDYGVVMPRWVGMLSVAMGTLVGQVVRRRVVALYPLSFFMPAAMLVGFVGMYLESRNPLFLAVAAVVGIGVLATGASMGSALLRQRKPQAEA
jgi:cyanate permease